MKRWFDLPYEWIAAAGAIVWLALILVLAMEVNSEHMTFRIALLVIAMGLSAKFLSGPSRLQVLSPLYLLGMMALVFYSLLPAVYVQFPETFRVAAQMHEMTMVYPDGIGELVIMQFAAFCFAVMAAYCYFQRGAAPRPVQLRPKSRWPQVYSAAVGLTIVFVAIIVANRYVPSVDDLLSSGIGREISDAQVPLLSLCLVTLAYLATDRSRSIVLIVMAVLVLVGLTVSGVGRLAILIVLSPMALMFAVGHVEPKALLGFAGVAIAVTLISIMSLSVIRQNDKVGERLLEPAALFETIRHQVVSKLIARQSISGMCFDRVVRENLNWENRGNPLFFAIAIVPRVLWPGKPNLSRGSEYAGKYCGMVVDPDAPHSESLTMLGEPVINGGPVGIALAQAFLAACLLAATILARRAGALGVISLAAMLPWLTQFEQHFALYFGNAVKMYLFMTPILAAWFILSRRTKRRQIEQSADP